MKFYRYIILVWLVFGGWKNSNGQRTYAPHSVLASGSWYKLSVNNPGIYKIDVSFLNALGINTSNLNSSSIRILGNGGKMLSEDNAAVWVDDLRENAIKVVDGGDGIFNGSDYLLFFAEGPNEWINDPANQRFIHQKNLYSDRSFYFINIGSNGKRMQAAAPVSGGPVVTNFSERYYHELDSVNFLSSGKEWFGEEFADAPGKSLSRTFTLNIPDLVVNSPFQFLSQLVARSIGTASRFDISINGQSLTQAQINPVSGGQYDVFANRTNTIIPGSLTSSLVNINLKFTPGSFNAQGWLNWFEFFPRRNLAMPSTGQLLFRDWLSVGNPVSTFQITQANPATEVWDVTDPISPVLMNGTLNGSVYQFNNNSTSLREYVATGTSYLNPIPIGKISNQDLHDVSAKDYLIITYPAFQSQAQRIADLHTQKNGYRSLVVTTEQIFNEFASGSPDPVAIRDFVKMYHDKFLNQPGDKPKYLLLFGDASFDYKDRIPNNTNFVPAYQSLNSLDPLSTYASDDFFGFLDDNENINSAVIINYLDIGIGRVPCRNSDEAKQYADKIYAYLDPASFGPWRNNLTLVADDEDQNLHLNDAEIFSNTILSTAPVFNQQKIYLDAFQQESGPGGGRYPQVNQAINNQILNGVLIWNYNGHGGSRRLAEETILDQQMVNSWTNQNKLPLFITATCDFAPYDQPLINSLGENIILRPKTGGIALMTTTRVVFAFSNRIMNDNYLRFALQPDANGIFRTLGQAVMDAKNYTYQTSGDITNNRKFTLLGDPALTLGFPKLRVRATSINNIPINQTDTLSATETVSIQAEITDLQGNIQTAFNGNGFVSVYDKPQVVQTRGNDPASPVTSFPVQTNLLFKGKATATNGKFMVTFKVPKDINFQYGNGKISFYAENGSTDATGFFTGFLVGGSLNQGSGDKEGPEIKAWLNDEKFVNGGITNQQPVLLLDLFDTSGINTVGTGIGHDIVATLDNDPSRYFILNDFFESEANSYQRGKIKFQLPELKAGNHSLHIKAWDVLNNSSEINLEFTVAPDGELTLSHVLNYPNPFTTNTSFWFEHNQPGQPVNVTIQVFTITGKLVKTIRQTITTSGNRIDGINWDGRDDYGDRLARGVYLYRLRVMVADKKSRLVTNKLVIF